MKLTLLHEKTLKLPKVARDQTLEISQKIIELYPKFMEALKQHEQADKKPHSIHYTVGSIKYINPYTGKPTEIFVDITSPRENDNTEAEWIDTMDNPTLNIILKDDTRFNVAQYYQTLILHELLHNTDPNMPIRSEKDKSKDFKSIVAGKYNPSKIGRYPEYDSYLSSNIEKRVWAAEMAAVIRSRLDNTEQHQGKEELIKLQNELKQSLKGGELPDFLSWRYKDKLEIWKKQPKLWHGIVKYLYDAITNYKSRYKEYNPRH